MESVGCAVCVVWVATASAFYKVIMIITWWDGEFFGHK